MTDRIKINIVSDVVCPWCVIGYKRLEKAINELGIQDKVDIQWEPFELNAHMPPEGQNLHEHMAGKYAMTEEDILKFEETLTNHGAELGFEFDYFEDMKAVNTHDAHLLLEYAKEEGRQTELKLRLFKAFFSDRQDVSSRDALIRIAQEAGLDINQALSRLTNAKAHQALQTRKSHWQNLGVMSVPTMIFNHESGINGAQPVEVYKQILTDLIENKKVEVLRNVAV